MTSPLVREESCARARPLGVRPATYRDETRTANIGNAAHGTRDVLGPSALLYDYLVRTHLWVASAVTSLSAFACAKLGREPDLTSTGIVFFSTVLIYNLDTALDLKQSFPQASGSQRLSPARAIFLRRRAQWLAGLALASLIVGLSLARLQTAVLVAIGASVGCLYAVPLGKHRRRLKAVPGSKSLVVGGAVAIAVVSVPLVEQSAAWSGPAWSTLFWLFTLTISNATLFDVRDFAQDSARGLKTLVVLFGVRRVRMTLLLLVSGSFALLSSLHPELAPLSLGLWLLLAPLTLFLGPSTPRAVFALVLDGALFVPWLFTLAT